jgi:hypothetical protein
LEVGRGSSIDCLVCQYHRFKFDASYYREPVEVPEEGATWENFSRLNKRRAAAFWMLCKGVIAEAGRRSPLIDD